MSPAIDEGALRGLLDDLGGDTEVVKELVQSYLEEAPRLLAEARQALAASDAATLQRCAHTLKSTSATFGALELAEASKDIEQAARAGKLPNPEALASLQAQFDAARAELVRRLA